MKQQSLNGPKLNDERISSSCTTARGQFYSPSPACPPMPACPSSARERRPGRRLPELGQGFGGIPLRYPAACSGELHFTNQAQKDARKLAAAGLIEKTKKILAVMENNPFQNPPPYEKLVGELSGAYSRRINIQHRLVYQVIKDTRAVKVLRMWTHYE